MTFNIFNVLNRVCTLLWLHQQHLKHRYSRHRITTRTSTMDHSCRSCWFSCSYLIEKSMSLIDCK